MSEQNKKYRRKVIGWAPGTDKPLAVDVDVYRVLDAFKVADPALQHLIKKALDAGNRGHKDAAQDYKDIVHSANAALDLLNAKTDEQDPIDLAARRMTKPPVVTRVFQFTFPKLKGATPSLNTWLEEQGISERVEDYRLESMDFSWLEDRVIGWMACPGRKTEAILESKLWEGFDPAEAYRQMAKWCEEHGSKGGAKIDTSTPGGDTDAPVTARRSHVSAAYLFSAPYGRVPQNHVRTLQHECPHCGKVILSNEIPRHDHKKSGYPGVPCPHCMGDLAGATFVAWADVEAIFDNLAKVPAAHLRGFLRVVRACRAGYGTLTSIRAALHTYHVQVMGGDAGEADDFAVAIWPDLAPETKPAATWTTLAGKLIGLGVGEGTEVVVSGGCDMKGKITKAVVSLGGVMRASVTPRTKLIIVGDKPGAKLAKAMALGVNIVFAANLRDNKKDDNDESQHA